MAAPWNEMKRRNWALQRENVSVYRQPGNQNWVVMKKMGF